MKIGIVGQGYVGTAVKVIFEKHYDVATYDLNKTLSSCKSLNELTNKSDIIFICLPTPMNSDGSCNLDIVKDVIRDVNSISNSCNDNKVVAIKSTVLPGTTDSLDKECQNISILFNPEFLTEANFIDDFKNQNRIIIGGEGDGVNILKQIYSSIFIDIPILITNSKIAEMVKYLTNTFLATKVSFANEMKLICNHLEINYDEVIEYAKHDRRLGESHWDVPGPDSHYGFGGSCFPKDINALIYFCKKNNITLETLIGAWETNLKVRPERDWEELKGRAVTSKKDSIKR